MWSTMRASFYTLLSAAFITSWPSTYTKVNSGKAYLVKTHRDVSNYNYFFKLVCLLGNNQIADCVWNVMAHALKPDFVFLPNGRVHLNRRGRQFSRLLAGELYTSACRVCTARASPCSAVMWRLLVTPLYSLVSPSLLLPCVTVCHHISTGLYQVYSIDVLTTPHYKTILDNQ